jgi:hypothetical protein
MKWYLRRLTTLVVAVSFGPICFGQTIKVRVVNGKTGHPLQKQPLSISLLYEKSEKEPAKYEKVLNLETDSMGESQFDLPNPAPSHLGAVVHLTSEHWHCGCVVLVTTQDLVKKGVVSAMQNANADASRPQVQAEPREILFVARPLTLFERLISPLVNQ